MIADINNKIECFVDNFVDVIVLDVLNSFGGYKRHRNNLPSLLEDFAQDDVE